MAQGWIASAQAGVVIDGSAPPAVASPRASWKVEGGTVTGTQDDAVYAQNKNHGPFLVYRGEFTDGTVSFSFRAQGCKLVALTLNQGEGHLVRLKMESTGATVEGWAKVGERGTTPLMERTGTPVLADGLWTKVRITCAGSQCTVAIGDFARTVEFPSVGQRKTSVTIGFAFGTVMIRDFVLEVPGS